MEGKIKTIKEVLTEYEYNIAIKNKKDKTWKEVIMGISKKDLEKKRIKELEKDFELSKK